MANKLLTMKEVSQEIWSDLQREAGGDDRKLRAMVYDLQTSLGGFPASKEQRDRYIETGKP